MLSIWYGDGFILFIHVQTEANASCCLLNNMQQRFGQVRVLLRNSSLHLPDFLWTLKNILYISDYFLQIHNVSDAGPFGLLQVSFVIVGNLQGISNRALYSIHSSNLFSRECFKYLSRSKSSKPHLERTAIVEHFCCGDPLRLLIKKEKLIQISLLISVLVRAI